MIKSPVLIIGCARSGTTLIYNILSGSPSLWSIGIESKSIIERFHHPSVKGWESGELSAADLTNSSRDYIYSAFTDQAAPGNYWRRVNTLRRRLNDNALYLAIKRRGRSQAPGSSVSGALPVGGLGAFRAIARLRNRFNPPRWPIRLLEKTPENCLRLPFMAGLFPDAKIIYLIRDGRANVHSLLEGWRQPRLFPGYDTPIPVTSPGQTRGRWAFTLIPGWRELVNRPLIEICAHQWAVSNGAVLDYAATPGALPVLTMRYENLIADADAALTQIAAFLDLDPMEIPAYGRPLPEINVVSRPGAEKWRREEEAINRISPIIKPMMERLGYGL